MSHQYLNLSREMRKQNRITCLEVTDCKREEEVLHLAHTNHRKRAERLFQHPQIVVALNLRRYLRIIARLKQWILML